MSETPDPLQPKAGAGAAAAVAALAHMPAQKQGSAFGKFIWGFFVVWACLAVAGELLYDGDLRLGRDTATASIIRACNKAFRAHPVLGQFSTDVTPAAATFEGADAPAAMRLLEDGGFILTDETRKYAAQMTYNDGVIEGTRDASHLWPEFLRKDTCGVKVFVKGDRVTGITAEAIRIARAEPVLQPPNAATGPVFQAAKSAVKALRQMPGILYRSRN